MEKKIKVLFLNATAHQLTNEQISEIYTLVTNTIKLKEGESVEVDIKNLKDINPELFNQLTNIQYETNTSELVIEFLRYLFDLINNNGYHMVYVHLPVGSPKFMFEFAVGIHELFYRKESPIIPVFSFSKRITEEVKEADGSIRKVSRFKFEGYQIPFVDSKELYKR